MSAVSPISPLQRTALAGLTAAAALLQVAARVNAADWPQWGRTPGHGASASVAAQPIGAILADFVYDPFAAAASAESGGNLVAHYPVPLLDGADVYMEVKTGAYVSCSPPGSGKPAPDSGAGGSGLSGWEPVFHPALAGDFLYVPGRGGSVFRVSKDTGSA